MEYLKLANSWFMWLAVIPPVSLTLIQAGIFTKRALNAGKEMGITGKQMKSAAIAAATASIGPIFVTAIGCIVLITAIGGPMAWMRLAYIGAVGFELTAAEFGATAAGAVLGGEGMTASVFACCCWVMCISCLGWIIVSALFTDKLDLLSQKVAGDNVKKLAILTGGGCLGAYAYLISDRVMASGGAFNQGNIVAIAVSFAVQVAISLYGKRAHKAWASTWGMTIAMFAGMIAAGLSL